MTHKNPEVKAARRAVREARATRNFLREQAVLHKGSPDVLALRDVAQGRLVQAKAHKKSLLGSDEPE